MAYTSLQDFYNQQYATDIAKNPGDYDVGRVLNTPSQKSALIRQVLPTLQEGGLYEIDGTKAIKQGNQFVPVIGDAEGVYGKATKLDFGQAELLPVGASIRPMEYAINAGQSSATAEAKYQSALNDTSTPRVSFDFSKVDAQGNPLATTMTGAEGLAAQNAARTAYNAETAKVTPYGYQETAQDKLVRENLAKGIPIGSANAPKEQPKYVSTYKGNSIIDFLSSVKQDSSFANRAKLAAEQGITGYKGTAEQNLALLAKLRGATTATPATETPKAPSGTTTASGMTSEEKITTPGATPGADTAGAMVTGAATTLADFLKQLTPAETETEKKQQTLLDKMTSLVGDAAKQSADQLTAEQAAGLPELRKQFADINGQILTKTAEYNALQVANANKPITMNTIIGNERAILNAQAADIGLLTARAQALQGQIETAQNTVNRSIDLKYDTISKQLDVYQAQLNALAPTLTKEEKRLATAQQLMIDERKQALEDKKNEEKSIQNLMVELAKSGITDASILSRVSSSKSYSQALNIATPLLGAKVAEERRLDLKIKQAQLSKLYADIAKTKTDQKRVTDVSKIQEMSGLTAEMKNNLILTEYLKNKDLGQTTRTNIGNSIGVFRALGDLAQANQDSVFAGVNPLNALLNIKIPFTNIGLPGRQVLKGEKAIQNEAYIEAINLKVQQWASGASLTNAQTEQVNKLTPRVTDTDENIKTKINGLANFMLTQAASQLQTEGIFFKPENVNLFETGDLLKKASPEQLAELRKLGLIK